MITVNLPPKPSIPTVSLSAIPPQTVFTGVIDGIEGLYIKLDTGGFTLQLWTPMRGAEVRTRWHDGSRGVENYVWYKNAVLTVNP